MPHAMTARAALRPTRVRGRRARRSALRLARRAFLAMRVTPLAVQIIVGTVLLVIVWAAVNWMVQVARKPTEVFVRSATRLPRRRRKPGGNTARSSTSTPRRSSHRNCWPLSPRWRAAATRSHGPTGGGGSAGTRSSYTDRPRAPSGCFSSPMERSQRPGAIASTITSSSRTGPGTTRTRAGSTRSTHAWCPLMPWR